MAVEERDVPPDVVLAPTGPLAEHHVTGGRRWSSSQGRASVGPLDERVFNPIGFLADVDGPVVALASLGVAGERPTEALVRSLRSARGVHAVASRRPARLVAGAGDGGVPVTVGSVGAAAAAARTRRWSAALTAPVDLDDAVGPRGAQRGAAPGGAAAFSTAAWRRRVAGLTGVRVARGAVGERGARHQAAGDAGLRAAAGTQAARRRPPAGAGAARLHARRRRAARAGARARRGPAARRVGAVRRRPRRRGGRRRRRPGPEDGRRRLVRPRVRRRPPARPRVLRRRDGRHAGRDALPGRA